MAIERISNICLGDMLLIFEQETDFNRIGFYMIPAEMESKIKAGRSFTVSTAWPS